jgi:regulatory protein
VKSETEILKDKACKFALSSLSRSDSSKKALYKKLLLRGFDEEIAEFALNYVNSFGYINERAQIERIATDMCLRHNAGERKIFLRLLSKGYDKADIKTVICELCEKGILDFSLAKERLLSKYGENISGEEIKKILYKNGFTNV